MLCALLWLVCSCHLQTRPEIVLLPTEAPPPGPRQIVVISDMHFGPGRMASDRWDPLEDFRWDDEFTQFLNTMDHDGSGHTDLVLNGDSFELWQSQTIPCRTPVLDLGCTEEEALARLRIALQAHDREMKALGAFAERGDNRVVFVPGNHDGALLLPRLAQAVVQASGARPERLHVSSAGFWLSADGQVYAEHGHQIGVDTLNRIAGWPRPFTLHGGVTYMNRPFGEQFVQEFFTPYELRYPIVDNIIPIADAVRYVSAGAPLPEVTEGGSRFLRFLLLDTSWEQRKSLLSPFSNVPLWDIKKLQKGGDAGLTALLPAGDPIAEALREGLRASDLPLSVSGLTRDQLSRLCDELWLLRRAQKLIGRPGSGTTCPVADSKAASLSNLRRDRNSVLAEYLPALRSALSQQTRGHGDLRVFVYSHTHAAEPPFTPFRGPWEPQVVNTGAWQRVVSTGWLEEFRQRRHMTVAATLGRLVPEDLEPCYTFVRIPPYRDVPRPQLESYRREGAVWQIFSGVCPAFREPAHSP